MTGDHRIEKVEILIQQNKFADAERILSDLLVNDPNNVYFLSLIAEVKMQQEKFDEANSVIDNAIGLSPDSSYLFYTKSRIAILQDNFIDAEKYIYEAIELDPYDADCFALLANIKLGRKQFSEALDAANEALEIDAENLLALNTRSSALNKLNRSEEAFETIEGALREDPNNSYTHSNYGWGLLEKGNHKKALNHFKEALTNDPTNDYAQAGMLEALKAANPVYRVFLKYSFWMGNLTAKYQWGVIIGFFVGVRILRSLARNNAALEPYLTPLIIALSLLAFSTWIITPISNLFLRFNKYGQLLLDRKQKLSFSFVAVSLFVFLSGVLLYFVLSDVKMLAVAVFGFAMMLPLGTMFNPSKNKEALLIYTIGLALIGTGGLLMTFMTGEMFNILSIVFVFGFIGFQWIANFILIREDNR